MRGVCTLAAASLLPAACGGSGDGGGDPPPTRVVVPEHDATPPEASISPDDGRPRAAVVRLRGPRLRATATGADEDTGVVRVRVSFAEVVSCRSSSGRTTERRRTRHRPEPQVERINARPGSRIATRDGRTVSLPLSLARCPRGSEPVGVRGEARGEAINGLGLEAVTPHTRVEWRP